MGVWGGGGFGGGVGGGWLRLFNSFKIFTNIPVAAEERKQVKQKKRTPYAPSYTTATTTIITTAIATITTTTTNAITNNL